MKIWYRLTVIIDGQIDSTLDSTNYDYLRQKQQQLELKGIHTTLAEIHEI